MHCMPTVLLVVRRQALATRKAVSGRNPDADTQVPRHCFQSRWRHLVQEMRGLHDPYAKAAAVRVCWPPRLGSPGECSAAAAGGPAAHHGSISGGICG